MSEYMTAYEVSEYLGISLGALYQWKYAMNRPHGRIIYVDMRPRRVWLREEIQPLRDKIGRGIRHLKG